jgi:hypothetical protein
MHATFAQIRGLCVRLYLQPAGCFPAICWCLCGRSCDMWALCLRHTPGSLVAVQLRGVQHGFTFSSTHQDTIRNQSLLKSWASSHPKQLHTHDDFTWTCDERCVTLQSAAVRPSTLLDRQRTSASINTRTSTPSRVLSCRVTLRQSSSPHFICCVAQSIRCCPPRKQAPRFTRAALFDDSAVRPRLWSTHHAGQSLKLSVTKLKRSVNHKELWTVEGRIRCRISRLLHDHRHDLRILGPRVGCCCAESPVEK